ncbi:hypothetical protein NE237_027637 [Protea cynaroides]|uniref:Uncharacterized protein n=1 Tax=Protea cynaroides TaxID=273540 RepID=A0A9Q0GNR4_9MAGN|nr:hypothetical protein NE237_027637 [Protea cynaroides]
MKTIVSYGLPNSWQKGETGRILIVLVTLPTGKNRNPSSWQIEEGQLAKAEWWNKNLRNITRMMRWRAFDGCWKSSPVRPASCRRRAKRQQQFQSPQARTAAAPALSSLASTSSSRFPISRLRFNVPDDRQRWESLREVSSWGGTLQWFSKVVDLKRAEVQARDGPSDRNALAKWRILNRWHGKNLAMHYKVFIHHVSTTIRPRGMGAVDCGEMISRVYNWPAEQAVRVRY